MLTSATSENGKLNTRWQIKKNKMVPNYYRLEALDVVCAYKHNMVF